MIATINIGDNCFYPERLPVKLGMDGPCIGYADNLCESRGVLRCHVHIDESFPQEYFNPETMRIAGLSCHSDGEPEVMYEIAILQDIEGQKLVVDDMRALRKKKRRARSEGT